MVSNESLTNAVRSLGYTFKKQTDRMMVWKLRGGVKRVMIRRNATHSAEYAETVLRQAGMPDQQIAAFIQEATITSH